MSRRDAPAAAVHLRIGRLVIDADALDGRGAPRDLRAQLQAALLPLLGGGEGASPPRTGWVDSVASEVASRVQPSMPERSR